MRVLVTGSGGQVGSELVASFSGPGREVVATTRATLDITSRDSTLQAITSTAPDVVVHTAAATDVDACELDPDMAFTVNALGTRHVAEGARRVGAHLVVLSTDYVFDGELDRPYTEWDEPNPQSVYGRSKLAGEREATAQVPGACVVRTGWVNGRVGRNIVKTVLRVAAASADPLRFVDDQHGCPTFADDLADAIVRLAVGRLPGTFHVTNQGATSWFGFARAIMTAAGQDPERVLPVSTAELVPPRPAPRPRSSVLDGAALRLSGLPLLDDYHEPLARLVKELRA